MVKERHYDPYAQIELLFKKFLGWLCFTGFRSGNTMKLMLCFSSQPVINVRIVMRGLDAPTRITKHVAWLMPLFMWRTNMFLLHYLWCIKMYCYNYLQLLRRIQRYTNQTIHSFAPVRAHLRGPRKYINYYLYLSNLNSNV